VLTLFHGARRFADLNEQEVLALAISAEEDDSRIYLTFAQKLQQDYPQTANVFQGMAAEEEQHRQRLIELHKKRFGEVIPLIRREHVSGFYNRNPIWLTENLGLERIRDEITRMETDSHRFYQLAMRRATDADTRKLLGELAAAEVGHGRKAVALEEQHLGESAKGEEDRQAHRQFILTWVQPGLAGLMDGSVSTLAPIFASAFSTQNPGETFVVGLAAAVGAGISMGFTEAVSDDGTISGRGSPLKRGISAGIMTTIGGLGHALPFLIPDFWTATVIAITMVVVELAVITWIQNRFMETPLFRAAFQVALGGALVFAAGILIGNA